MNTIVLIFAFIGAGFSVIVGASFLAILYFAVEKRAHDRVERNKKRDLAAKLEEKALEEEAKLHAQIAVFLKENSFFDNIESYRKDIDNG